VPDMTQISAMYSLIPADSPTINVSSASGKAGDEVTVTISLDHNPGIAGYGLTLLYDTDRLTFISAEAGDAMRDNFNYVKGLAGENSISFEAFNSRGEYSYTGSILFTATFKINEGVRAGVIDGNDFVFGYFDDFNDGFSIADATGVAVYDVTQGIIAVEEWQEILPL